MKKKVFAIVTLLMLVVSIFASVPVMADEAATEEIGGLDFYSITVHYENPVLMSYYETKIEVVKDNGKTTKVPVKYFYNTDAENDDGKYMNGEVSLTTDKVVIAAGSTKPGDKFGIQNFYQLSTYDDSAIKYNTGLWYANVPYVNAFLTHIVDNSVISTTGKVNLKGIEALYDDKPYEHKNPNFQYADDGYALAAEKDVNGNNLKIDVNGYLVDSNTKNSVWKTSDDERVELFTQIPVVQKTGLYNAVGKCPECNAKKTASTELSKTKSWTCKNGHEVKGKPETKTTLSNEYEWVPFKDRFDENGKIVAIQELSYKYMVTEEEYNAFLESDQTSLKMYRTDNAELFEEAGRSHKYKATVQTYLVDSKKGPDTYWSVDRQFTQNDLVVDEKTGIVALATPLLGTPISNVKIKDITVEIDALGAQIFADNELVNDPQQKNTITVSINECAYNANLYKQWFDEGFITQDEFAKRARYVLGTAKSKTTRTEITTQKADYKSKDEYGYSPTVVSISIGASADLLAKIPSSAKIFIEFDINTQQPEAAWNKTYQNIMVIKSDTNSSTVITEKIDILTDADKPKEKPKQNEPVVQQNTTNSDSFSFSLSEIFSEHTVVAVIITVLLSAIVIAGIVVVILVVLKKKKK